MKTRVNSRMFAVVAVVAGALAAVGCGVNMNYASDAGSGPVCATALDCDGLPHLECDGQWLCDPAAACIWNCLPPQDCKADADCEVWAQALDVACTGHAACESGKCGWTCEQVIECMGDTDCPDGYACEWSDVPVPMGGDTAQPSNATKCAAPGLKCAVVEPGKCVKKQVVCYSDADCPVNQECVYDVYPAGGTSGSGGGATTGAMPKCGATTNAGGLKCISGGVCMDKVTDIPCGSDAECPAGFHCEWLMYGGDDATTGSGGGSGGGGTTPCDPAGDCIAPSDGLCVRDGECVCAEYYQPVCGTDGVTYGNECFAGCAGVGIAFWGECGTTACTSDYDCGAGFRCEFLTPCAGGGSGVPVESDGGTAVDAGPYCQGVCVPVQSGCQSDNECAPGTRCVRMPCDCMDTDPSCFDKCQQGGGWCEPITVSCTVDSDCRANEQCQIDACADCAPGTDCQGGCFGHCVARSFCTADYDCGPGGRCIMDPCPDCPECGMCAGHCDFTPPVCYTDSDCAPGEICKDPCPAGDCMAASVCVPAEVPCYTGSDCGAGQFCDHTGYADAPGCCVPDANGMGCPADYPYCYGVCRPIVCKDPVVCGLYCEFGFQRDASGCEICSCNQPPQKCETVTDPTTGTTCTRCYNADGSVTESCGVDQCWGAWLDQNGLCRTPSDGVYPPECCAPKACTMDQPACASDMDCRGGAAGICVSGCCQFPTTCVETFAACTDDTMCPQGTSCFDGACCYGLK